MASSVVPDVPWTVRVLSPEIAAVRCSETHVFAVPGTPSRSSARSVASVATATSISRAWPMYFGVISVPSASVPPSRYVVTAHGDSRQRGGGGGSAAARRRPRGAGGRRRRAGPRARRRRPVRRGGAGAPSCRSSGLREVGSHPAAEVEEGQGVGGGARDPGLKVAGGLGALVQAVKRAGVAAPAERAQQFRRVD